MWSSTLMQPFTPSSKPAAFASSLLGSTPTLITTRSQGSALPSLHTTSSELSSLLTISFTPLFAFTAMPFSFIFDSSTVASSSDRLGIT